MNSEDVRIVEFKIHRFDPEKNSKHVSTYEIPVNKGTTILEALNYIKDKLDGTLSYRHSCRMGVCGSCGINVNGKPILACYTQVLDLGVDSLSIEPLANMTVIKDLVVDMQQFFDKYMKIDAFLIRKEEELEEPREFNQTPHDLKEYWDLSLCIKCSICYSVCPAVLDEKFLGPSALTSNYRFIKDSRDDGHDQRIKPMVDNIWLCTQCGSCTFFCPKNLECADAILEDHSLIVETGNIPRTAKDVLESAYKHHNPMGTIQAKRMDWAKDINVPTYPTVTKADVLFFVCCSNAYDLRNQATARNMVAIFKEIGVSFATLNSEQWCCGDHMLRMGEKGLFEELAEHNISLFKGFDAKKIVTLSPHCYNVFKNDRPYNESKLEVKHYTQFLADAIKQGKINPSKTINRKVAYHDACFLGKRNDVYDAPRQILQSIKGLKLVEMRRNKENSFCCGGGGGRVWTEEAPPEKRPSVDRVKEALELGVDTIAVACPFCITMLEDAAKVLDVEDKIVVADILELLYEAL